MRKLHLNFYTQKKYVNVGSYIDGMLFDEQIMYSACMQNFIIIVYLYSCELPRQSDQSNESTVGGFLLNVTFIVRLLLDFKGDEYS